jgi:hypothetical protein
MNSLDKKTLANDALAGVAAAREILDAAEKMLVSMTLLVSAMREFTPAMVTLSEQLESDGAA